MSEPDRPRDLDTRLAQACHFIETETGGISPPIHPSSTYARDAQYRHIGDFSYSRSGNPSWRVLEDVCADIDGGAAALCFASGMAAVTSVLETVASGERVVAPRVMYHGSQDWLRRIADRRAIDLALFDATDPGALAAAIRPGKTSLVWIEPLLNPTWDVIDIAAAAELAHAAGALLVVDATVCPPVTTRALEHGADIVFHSATKYLNGHSDLLAGILVSARRDERWAEIEQVRLLTGGVLGPFEAWLLLRGMRTLALRFDRASANALAIARRLEHHPLIERVLYPGLESHPGHEIAARQMTRGFGGMLSLLVRGGGETARSIASSTRVLVPATSLGGVESLIEHRAAVEGPHSAVPQNLLRLSIGIENADDLLADLEQALEQV
ncbi:MAG: PLP-dependent aspartate aminotransferase family protein [Gammaproteobacteria bacterium]|nr:PLP-dependent aspartate aminotransferase family protein [Gammaproteobacteria bacterium]